MTNRTFAYIRVSTDEQALEGYSVEAQQKVINAYCIVRNLSEPTFFIDAGYSARTLNRPAIKEALQRIKNNETDNFLVWRLDRLSRSLKNTLHIVDDIIVPSNTNLISVTENIDTSTPAGRLMINILASFAQAESENTQQRVIMVNMELAKTARHLGGVPPLGYKVVDGFYQIDESIAPHIKQIFHMFINQEGYTAIQNYLAAHNIKSARGNDINKSGIYEIITNVKYTGTYVYNRSQAAKSNGKRNHHASKPENQIIKIPNAFPAIIDSATWTQTQKVLAENKSKGARFATKQVYLLSGIVKCGVCNEDMIIRSGSKDRDGTTQRYYVCKNKCVTAARKEQIEAAAINTIRVYALQETNITKAANIANTFSKTKALEDAPYKLSIQNQIQESEEKIKSITDFIIASGAKAPSSLVNELNALEEHIRKCQEELEALKNQSKQIDSKRIIQTLRRLSNMHKWTPEEQRSTLNQLVSSVIVTNEVFQVLFNIKTLSLTPQKASNFNKKTASTAHNADCMVAGGGEGN